MSLTRVNNRLERLEKKFLLKNGKEINVILFDTAGQERFRETSIKAIRNVQEIIIVFQMTNRKSFEVINKFIQIVKENLINPKLVLFGNKIDIEKEEWEVTSEEAKEFAKKIIYLILKCPQKQNKE